MKIDLEFAELHSPLFLGGKNHQMKLTAGARTKLQLVYDRAEKELLVFWDEGQHEAIVPVSNVSSMTPKRVDKVEPEVEPEVKPAPVSVASVARTAQVSTPQSHVFAGEGKGKR